MPNIFISYSHKDRELAKSLVARLQDISPSGTDVFIDQAIDEKVQSIPNGAYWLPYLGQRLRSANAVVAVITPSYLNSDACWFEMSAALAMEKLLPLNLGDALDLGRLGSLVSQKNISSVSAAWLTKAAASNETQDAIVFKAFAVEVAAACDRNVPFSDWVPAVAADTGALAKKLERALQPGWFKNTGLQWLPGRLRKPQQDRFFVAIRSMANVKGDSTWEKGVRKALKALADRPASKRIRAEALMGLIGELMMPSDQSAPDGDGAHWKFAGDLALPIDRDLSRFAYLKAGDVPNELRTIFQVLSPRVTGRTTALTVGLVGGGVLGFLLGYGVSNVRLPCPNCPPPPPPCPPGCPPPQLPAALTIAVPVAPPDPPQTFIVGSLGLEASVIAELKRRGMQTSQWRTQYSEVIASNLVALCSPERWQAAKDGNRAPLDLIGERVALLWPTADQARSPTLLKSCPASTNVAIAVRSNAN